MPPLDSGKFYGFVPRWLLIGAAIFFVVLALAAAGGAVLTQAYNGRILPNVFVGELNLGGLSAAAAGQLLNAKIDKISQDGITVRYKDKQAIIKPVVASTDADLAYRIITFNADDALTKALNYGHDQNFFLRLANACRAMLFKKHLEMEITLNRQAVEKILREGFPEAYSPSADAALVIVKAQNDYQFSVTPEKIGKIIDYEAAGGQLIENLKKLDAGKISLVTVTSYPKIFVKDVLNVDAKARATLKAAPLTLKYGDNSWTMTKDELAGLLALKPNAGRGDKITVGLDEAKTSGYLKEKVASRIDRPAIEAKFEFKNGRVSEFQNGQDGLALDVDLSQQRIEAELSSGAPIELIIKELPVLTKAGSLNDFGIKEIIGVGTSNFAGSPVNRRHNIRVGAASVNGSLIKPGEQFSLLKTLGEVASSSGYLPELVIKEGKTIPEFGGGLCQIGTTVFRAALASGLPVTMRQNHSYRVQYYEPAGTDATIYDPWPDFRFINDTASHVLIQAKFSGDNLSFEFWGTGDGRKIDQGKPVIYNIVKPEPTKIIETLELKPGVKKCTEHAHNGADAYFDYKVAYADGTEKGRRFSSHYVPWQEVCLLGVEKLTPPPESATSTPAEQISAN